MDRWRWEAGVGPRAEEPRQQAWTPARGNAHTHSEGHWTWGEWLRVNNIWSPVTQIPIRTSAMKHLPIKSNDACDLKGITVKWCVQRHYGHLQMAGVQEVQAAGWARNGFNHQYELNVLCYKPDIIIWSPSLCSSSSVIYLGCTVTNCTCINIKMPQSYLYSANCCLRLNRKKDLSLNTEGLDFRHNKSLKITVPRLYLAWKTIKEQLSLIVMQIRRI